MRRLARVMIARLAALETRTRVRRPSAGSGAVSTRPRCLSWAIETDTWLCTHARARCQRTVLAADLREDWPAALTAAGFQPTQPTAWLAEGLLIYLSADQAAHLLTSVGELSASASQLAFEHGTIADTSLLAQARAMPAMDQFTSLWKGGLGAHAPDWLIHHGWQVQTHDRAALAAAHGRAVPGLLQRRLRHRRPRTAN